jgi:hypothetical protein
MKSDTHVVGASAARNKVANALAEIGLEFPRSEYPPGDEEFQNAALAWKYGGRDWHTFSSGIKRPSSFKFQVSFRASDVENGKPSHFSRRFTEPVAPETRIDSSLGWTIEASPHCSTECCELISRQEKYDPERNGPAENSFLLTGSAVAHTLDVTVPVLR